MESKPSLSQFIIYMLHHPNSKSGSVYIGKSSSGLQRPRDHWRPSSLKRYAHLARTKWVKKRLSEGVIPEIAILEECGREEDLNEAEIRWIAIYRARGIPLLNGTDGGDGFTGEHTEEARAKMSEKNKWRGDSERMVRIAKDYWSDPTARKKQSKKRRGKKWDEATRAKMSASAKGVPKSAEHRKNMSIAATSAMKLRWQDPVYRQQQVEMQKAVRAQKSEAAKRQWDPIARAKKAEEVRKYWAARREKEISK